jgi:hypothetical protein
MKCGSLVVTRNRWGLMSLYIGLVVQKLTDTTCLVLWSTTSSKKLQEHYEDALLELNDDTIEEVEKRGCISA